VSIEAPPTNLRFEELTVLKWPEQYTLLIVNQDVTHTYFLYFKNSILQFRLSIKTKLFKQLGDLVNYLFELLFA
jgi:hypothetical protein